MAYLVVRIRQHCEFHTQQQRADQDASTGVPEENTDNHGEDCWSYEQADKHGSLLEGSQGIVKSGPGVCLWRVQNSNRPNAIRFFIFNSSPCRCQSACNFDRVRHRGPVAGPSRQAPTCRLDFILSYGVGKPSGTRGVRLGSPNGARALRVKQVANMFLLIMVPTSQEFNVPLTAFVLSVTLWLRLVGEVGSGWLAGRVERKIPLMISILWYSLANLAAGFSLT